MGVLALVVKADHHGDSSDSGGAVPLAGDQLRDTSEIEYVIVDALSESQDGVGSPEEVPAVVQQADVLGERDCVGVHVHPFLFVYSVSAA